MTKSTELNNNEFICHVENEYDYTFICEKREELFEHLKECFFNIMNDNLPIFGVPGNVSQYATSKKDIKNDNPKQPPDSFRLRAEDLFEPIVDAPLGNQFDGDELPTMDNKARCTFAGKGHETNKTLADFEIKKVIGRGSFGKVFLVCEKGT